MRLPSLLALALLSSSPAAAAWSWAGGEEPSTAYDVAGGMWLTEPGFTRDRVYFNVVSMLGPQGAGIVNPNLAVVPTSVEPFGTEYHEAILGIWVDCNQDGIVGMAEAALREYPAELLLDDSFCPPISGPVDEWRPGAHNYNAWVTELVPITNYIPSGDARYYFDATAAVWGDRGLPGPHLGPCRETPDLVLRAYDCVRESVGDLDRGVGDLLPDLAAGEPKRSSDWLFRFSAADRGTFLAEHLRPGEAGADGTVGLTGGPRWVAETSDLKPLPRAVRTHAGDPVDDAAYYSFYAYVSLPFFAGAQHSDYWASLPNGAGWYGEAFCSEPGPSTWDCDGNAWYRRADGTPLPGKEGAPRPGWSVSLRDVDCYDGSIGDENVGIGVSPVYYGNQPCLRA